MPFHPAGMVLTDRDGDFWGRPDKTTLIAILGLRTVLVGPPGDPG